MNRVSKIYRFSYLIAIFVVQMLIINTTAAQQIVTDNFTNTTLNINGNTTNVSTSTIQGVNAFNSFTRFNVDAGNIVNLVVPGNVTNLINIVKNEPSQINGTLNSLKNGLLGGNVFIANPHGIFIGQQGAINVGSLVAITPTQAFVDNFFTAPGNPDPQAVNDIVNDRGSIQVTSVINNSGTVSAQQNIEMDTGSMINSGTIQMTDLVNANNLTNGNLLVNSGSTIEITGVIKTAGKVSLIANGSITENSAGEQPNIVANSILLQAVLPQGPIASIGALNNDINLASANQANPEMEIETLSSNDTCLTMNQGTMKIKRVNSLTGHVFLTAAGDILNNKNDGSIVISGRDITLNSNNSSLGNWNSGNPQPVTLELKGGMVTGQAKGGIFLSGPGGTLAVNQIQNSGTNKIIFTADNGITNGPMDTTPNFITNDLTLKSDNGNIGIVNVPVNTDLGTNQIRGTLEARSMQDMNLNNNSHSPNINLRKLISQNGNLAFKTNSGIHEAPGHEELTIVAFRNITLLAIDQSSIGMDNDPIDIALGGALHAQAYGYINILSHSNLRVDLVSNAGRYPVELKSLDQYIAGNDQYYPCIVTNDLFMSVPKGGIDVTMDTNYLGKGGFVSVDANWIINLTETSGNLVYDEVKSTYLDVNLTSKTGSILVYKQSSEPGITARRINLTAAKNIGAPLTRKGPQFYCLFIKHDNNGYVSANSWDGSINIGNSLDDMAETNADMILDEIYAPNGEAYIQSGNNIYSAGRFNSKVNTQTFSFYTTSGLPNRTLGTQGTPINLNNSAQFGFFQGFNKIYINRY